jgi:hypothetical protein
LATGIASVEIIVPGSCCSTYLSQAVSLNLTRHTTNIKLNKKPLERLSMFSLSKRRRMWTKDEDDEDLCSTCSALDLRAIFKDGIPQISSTSTTNVDCAVP